MYFIYFQIWLREFDKSYLWSICHIWSSEQSTVYMVPTCTERTSKKFSTSQQGLSSRLKSMEFDMNRTQGRYLGVDHLSLDSQQSMKFLASYHSGTEIGTQERRVHNKSSVGAIRYGELKYKVSYDTKV